jgi:hypothetical protein
VRETARALHTRAMLAVHDGNTTSAVTDIEALLRFSLLLTDYPALTDQMVGVAVAGIGISACYQYCIALRDNPAAMDALAQMLDKQGVPVHISLNWDAMRRGEPGLWDVAPSAEWVAASLLRCNENTLGRDMQLQQIRIAVALERYRADNGSYPERLELLVPEYVSRLPVDPWSSKPYIYEPHERDFVLTARFGGEPFEGPLKFPPLSVEELKESERRKGH